MVRTVGEDPIERKIIEDVWRYGWHGVTVAAEGGLPPYAFTVGLQHSHAHPEFVIFGLPPDAAWNVLEAAVAALEAGTPLALTEPTDRLLEGYACVFVRVPPAALTACLRLCEWFYEGAAFEAYQIVWPDRTGRLPWHPDASMVFQSLQPVLGDPSDVA